jgi:hypothetical protein
MSFQLKKLLESDVRWIPKIGMLCHDMARITTLCFHCMPFFSEAGRKSKRYFLISKLSMKNFSFYSAAEADMI